MNLFYTCPENNCHKKYKKRERMDQHLVKDHGLNWAITNEPMEPIDISKKEKVDSFYLCPTLNCNRKFKKKDRLEAHLLEYHKIIDAEISEPVRITKENKKQV